MSAPKVHRHLACPNCRRRWTQPVGGEEMCPGCGVRATPVCASPSCDRELPGDDARRCYCNSTCRANRHYGRLLDGRTYDEFPSSDSTHSEVA